MNEIFLIGKVITDIKFDFIINSKKHISISEFTVETLNKQEIRIVAYDDIADFCYSKFNKDDMVVINGKIRNDNIEIYNIEKYF